ncbi:MAG: DUF2062 domain-containing protein [Sulfuriflexus sp.]|nr:DUF2062 domain-containing protein [Sulfuriflexus sp.]
MTKKLVQRYMPSHDKVLNNKYLKIFGTLLHDPNLFHINRRSVAGAFAVGLFFAWVPVPFQMVLATAVAIPARVNLIISVALVWISNPLTMPPLFYFAYRLGGIILGIEPNGFDFELSFAWLANGLLAIWQPFLLGCAVMAVSSSIIGYVAIRLLWRWNIVRRWEQRKRSR